MRDNEGGQHPDAGANSLSPLERLAWIIQTINGWIITVLAFAMVACVTWQVLARVLQTYHLIDKTSTTTDELARFMFMWIGLLGAVQASALKKHLAIDLMAMKLKGVKKKILSIFIESCVIAFSLFAMIWGGWRLTSQTFANQQITPALQISMGYVYMIVPIAGVLMAFFSVVAIYQIVNGADNHLSVED